MLILTNGLIGRRYFAKTAGMLGTYNNEQYDEMLTAEKRVATSPEQLADSWTVGSKCRIVNNARQHRPEDSSTARPVCAKYFQVNAIERL